MLCLECQKSVKGRSDKKYCSDSCRSSFHNRKQIKPNERVLTINNILSQNRVILENFIKNDIYIVDVSKLQKNGFNLKYFTHQFRISKIIEYRFCYEIGYRYLTKDRFKLLYLKEFNKKYGITI